MAWVKFLTQFDKNKPYYNQCLFSMQVIQQNIRLSDTRRNESALILNRSCALALLHIPSGSKGSPHSTVLQAPRDCLPDAAGHWYSNG